MDFGRWFFVVAIAASLVGCGPGERGAIEVVSWNIQFFPGRYAESTPEEERAHVAEAQAAVRTLGADVLCLQEMKSREAAAELVAGTPGLDLRVCSAFENPGGLPLQIAIASREKPIAQGWEAFAGRPGNPPFGLVHALFEWEGEHLLVGATHLRSNRSGIEVSTPTREAAARIIVEIVEEKLAEYREGGFEEVAVLLCGDFNMDPGGGEWEGDRTDEILRAAGYAWGFEGVAFKDRVTWLSNGKYPDASFDHVFYKPNPIGEVGVERVVVEDPPSDHLPVRARVRGR